MDRVKEFAKKILEKLNYGPGLIFLEGDLGAGKTTLTKAIVEILLKNSVNVTSPTYSYMHTYNNSDINIYHFDLYRIEKERDIEDLGLLDFIYDDKSLRIIEWPQKALSYLPKPDLKILLKIEKGERTFYLSPL